MSNNNEAKVNNGNTVSVHYKGTLEDGSQFDSSYDRGDPISFTVGSGQMIEGFENNILGMSLGERKTFTITSDKAYGPHIAEAIHSVPKSNFPSDFDFTIGGMVTGSQGEGRPVVGKILEEKEDSIVLDFNHPMAGKDLTFEVEVVTLSDETEGA